MKVFVHPDRDEWSDICARPALDHSELQQLVADVFREVRTDGDKAVRHYTRAFDGVEPASIQVADEIIENAGALLDIELKSAIDQAADNIRRFHALQLNEEERLETMPGVTCWRKRVPIEKVGLYIPGGTAPLFSSVLMLAIPAALAGCKEIVLCTPPGKGDEVHPAILYAASVAGVHKVYRIGGVQAIAAMVYGTSTVTSVYKIFGPGNQYVTAAKQYAQQIGVAIDMPAGPSEVLVIADEQSDPDFVAIDLLSQAEHGADSQVVLLTTDESFVMRVQASIERLLDGLPRKEIALKALAHSFAVVLERKDLMEFSNTYAPEHLIIQTGDADVLAEKVINAGSVFIGPWTPESAGDYASGTNHTLPTNYAARAYSGVSCDTFLRTVTFQQINETGLRNVGPIVEKMAAAEQLEAHKQAVTIRLNRLK